MLATLALLFLAPKVDLDVTYSRVPGMDLKMDIYRPEAAVATKAAVLVIHGGAWIGGDKSEMKPLCLEFAKQGVLAASVQYRLAPKTRWPGFYDDVQVAVRYLRENASKLGIDPKRIGSCGASAGGHLALLLGFTDTRDLKSTEYARHSSRVSAVFDIFGPTDMSRDFPKSYDMLFAAVLGKQKELAGAEIKAASPVTFIDRLSAPVFILHGTADPVVPVAQSRWLEQRLRANRTAVEARYIEGMKHEIPISNPAVVKAVQEGISWLKTNLLR
ncbi:MAG: alpha/beta hydrolase [Chlorobia bacterium]|nr:alpha/beta hydrolase [Fimbriimonadaceae bacterium]